MLSGGVRPNGLEITKVRVPLGVIGIIFEARPNVTSDAAALCLKAGNAVILRGGKEAIHSNLAIAGVMREAVAQAGLPRDSGPAGGGYIPAVIGGADGADGVFRRADSPGRGRIDQNRGGEIQGAGNETGVGNCHVYIDSDADLEMAASVVYNAKTSRPSVCNAIETIFGP